MNCLGLSTIIEVPQIQLPMVKLDARMTPTAGTVTYRGSTASLAPPCRKCGLPCVPPHDEEDSQTMITFRVCLYDLPSKVFGPSPICSHVLSSFPKPFTPLHKNWITTVPAVLDSSQGLRKSRPCSGRGASCVIEPVRVLRLRIWVWGPEKKRPLNLSKSGRTSCCRQALGGTVCSVNPTMKIVMLPWIFRFPQG